ncbi:hypothetical protein FB567DRAFT_633788 [Paraphoma chrysanthemicola]|uniref:Uncharacterized protein n=1 Tax=Paraphoma chrysanthemicola TaxID=798071 RepID=A0A8K0QT52_9PLEO|nr:hypothetical protein FB567DRAFT_633788 [Paraphoma chrysanthemicola]
MSANDNNRPLPKRLTNLVLPDEIVRMGRDICQKGKVTAAQKEVLKKFKSYYEVEEEKVPSSSPYYGKTKDFNDAVEKVRIAMEDAEAEAQDESASGSETQIAKSNDTEESLGATSLSSVKTDSSSIDAEDDASPDLGDTASVLPASSPRSSPGHYNHARVPHSSVLSNTPAVPVSYEANDPTFDPEQQGNPASPAGSDGAGRDENAEEVPTGASRTIGNTVYDLAGVTVRILTLQWRHGPGPHGRPQVDQDAHDQMGIHNRPEAQSPARVREDGSSDAVDAKNGADHLDGQHQAGPFRNRKRSPEMDDGEAVPARKRPRHSDNDAARQNGLGQNSLRQAGGRQDDGHQNDLREADPRHNSGHHGISVVSRQSAWSGSSEIVDQEEEAADNWNDDFPLDPPKPGSQRSRRRP